MPSSFGFEDHSSNSPLRSIVIVSNPVVHPKWQNGATVNTGKNTKNFGFRNYSKLSPRNPSSYLKHLLKDPYEYRNNSTFKTSHP